MFTVKPTVYGVFVSAPARVLPSPRGRRARVWTQSSDRANKKMAGSPKAPDRADTSLPNSHILLLDVDDVGALFNENLCRFVLIVRVASCEVSDESMR